MVARRPLYAARAESNNEKMKIVLPIGKSRAWKLLTTRRGICSWYAVSCNGKISTGEQLEFSWTDEKPVKHRVLSMGQRHSSFLLERKDGTRLSFYLHGRLTTLTLEIAHPPTKGRRDRTADVRLWAFFLANLKSVALGGPDLRNTLRGRSWKHGFID
jgi:hypothetical protein